MPLTRYRCPLPGIATRDGSPSQYRSLSSGIVTPDGAPGPVSLPIMVPPAIPSTRYRYPRPGIDTPRLISVPPTRYHNPRRSPPPRMDAPARYHRIPDGASPPGTGPAPLTAAVAEPAAVGAVREEPAVEDREQLGQRRRLEPRHGGSGAAGGGGKRRRGGCREL